MSGEVSVLLRAVGLVFVLLVGAMGALVWSLGLPPRAGAFHVLVAGLVAYSLLVSTVLLRALGRLALAGWWFVALAGLVLVYVLYYIAVANWGLPLHVTAIWHHADQLPYILRALPFPAGASYALIALPLVLTALLAYRLRDGLYAGSTALWARWRGWLLLGLAPPLLAGALVWHGPTYAAVRAAFDPQHDPLLALVFFRNIQHNHTIEGVGADHARAEATYRPQPMVNRPNVVLILCDALRADHLSTYGYPRPTAPFLDSLARQRGAFVHRRYFANSGASFTGITATLGSRAELTLNSFMLHEVLSKQGYFNRFLMSGDFLGFYNIRRYLGDGIDQYYDGRVYQDDPFAGPAATADDRRVLLGYLRDRLPPWSGRPEFLYLHFMSAHQLGEREAAHTPYLPDEGSFVNPTPPPFVNDYDNRVTQLDQLLRESVAALTRKGYLDDALLIITADHGQSLLENGHLFHGKSTDMSETYIPLILRRSGPLDTLPTPAPGAIHDQLDLAPTVLDLLGLPAPFSWRGHSIFDAAAGGGPVFQREAHDRSVITRMTGGRLFQFTQNDRSGSERLRDVTNPAAPREVAGPPGLADSLRRALEAHFR